MDEKNDMDKIDDVMLPGFRFHPTDEELVGFYLRRKIQQRLLPIELIKQVDIYKYDPWDLPSKIACLLFMLSSEMALILLFLTWFHVGVSVCNMKFSV